MASIKYYAKIAVHGALACSGRILSAGHASQSSLTIFTYHSFCTKHSLGDMSSIPIDRFERQIEWLREAHVLVSLAEGLEILNNAPRQHTPMAAITIDDGFENNYQIAWPVLIRQQVPATIFIATDFIDTCRPPWPTRLWDIVQALQRGSTHVGVDGGDVSTQARYRRLQVELRRKSATARWAALDDMVAEHKLNDLPTRPALNWDQIREMATGGIEFGSHTVSHGYLPSLQPAEVSRELTESKRRIEQELQRECRYFAYPNGDWSATSACMVREAGYHAAVTQDFGSNMQHRDRCALLRVEVPSDDPLASFRYRAMRATATIRTVVKRRFAGIL